MQHGILRERVFGCDLGERLALTGRDTPLVLELCAGVVEEHGIVDGIYRLSGIVSNLQKLRYGAVGSHSIIRIITLIRFVSFSSEIVG